MSRVLMVDDAGLFQILEGTFLRRLGCAIVRAADGPDLLARAQDPNFDLILLDAAHPGLDAPACVRALKSRTVLRDVPVAVVADPAGLEACCEAGADMTLATPLPAGALEMALCSLGRVARRAGDRRSARGAVRIASSAGALRARLKDISRTGAFLRLPASLPLDAAIQLSLRLPAVAGATRRLRTRGVVVRRVAGDPDSHLIAGVGVRFTDLDPSAAQAIEDYVLASCRDGRATPGPGGDPAGNEPAAP